MKGTIVFDFDYTLLDTTKIKESIRQGLANKGVHEQAFLESWEKAVLRPDGSRDYDPELHADLIASLTGCAREDAASVIAAAAGRCGAFLFSGAETVLRRLRADGWTLVLLTRGVVSWQKRKFAASGLHGLFAETYFLLESKRTMASKIASFASPVVMVNDDGLEIDALQTVLPDVRMIAVRGPRKSPSDPSVVVCGDMADVYKEIAKL